MTEALAEYLSWDSEFFDRRTARVLEQALDQERWVLVERWCREQKIQTLYFLAESTLTAGHLFLESIGFIRVDERVLLSLTLPARVARPALESCAEVRHGSTADLPQLKGIALTAFRDGRFYHDPVFSKSKADEFYATWVENSFHGLADQVFTAIIRQEPVGFVTCVRSGEKGGQIGLIGVRDDVRNQQIGQHLMSAAIQWFADHGMNQVDVVTQGRNQAAISFYKKVGFQIKESKVWYHKHF